MSWNHHIMSNTLLYWDLPLPSKSTFFFSAFLCFQVVGIKRKMRRPLVSRVYMYKKSHRLGFLRHLQQLRKPFPVSSVSQSWKPYWTWLSSKQRTLGRKHSSVTPVWEESISVQTFTTNRGLPVERSLGKDIWTRPPLWPGVAFMYQGHLSPVGRFQRNFQPSQALSHTRPLLTVRSNAMGRPSVVNVKKLLATPRNLLSIRVSALEKSFTRVPSVERL